MHPIIVAIGYDKNPHPFPSHITLWAAFVPTKRDQRSPDAMGASFWAALMPMEREERNPESFSWVR